MWKWLPWLLVVLSLATAIWNHQRRAEARERAAEIEAVADSLLGVIGDRGEVIDSLELRVDSAEAVLDSVTEWSNEEVAEARADQAEAERRLREFLSDPEDPDADPVADLDALLAAHRQEVAALTARLEAYAQLVLEQEELIEWQGTQLEDYELATERLEELVAFWEGEANPPFWTAMWEDLPTILIAGGAGLVLGLALSQ